MPQTHDHLFMSHVDVVCLALRCRLLYKLRGPSAPLNLGLDADQRTRLDGMTLTELLAELQGGWFDL